MELLLFTTSQVTEKLPDKRQPIIGIARCGESHVI
jgi:hypothetical protein